MHWWFAQAFDSSMHSELLRKLCDSAQLAKHIFRTSVDPSSSQEGHPCKTTSSPAQRAAESAATESAAVAADSPAAPQLYSSSLQQVQEDPDVLHSLLARLPEQVAVQVLQASPCSVDEMLQIFPSNLRHLAIHAEFPQSLCTTTVCI
jgi:hypothetical protein